MKASPPEIDEDDDEIPEKRGRGRRKKNEGKSSGGSMEAYIRNRPLQIDINKPLIKKGNVAAPNLLSIPRTNVPVILTRN